MHIVKTDIVAALRERGAADRADWVDRALPALVDTDKNRALLEMLNIDLDAMATVEVAARPS
jgi:hypothetical protein